MEGLQPNPRSGKSDPKRSNWLQCDESGVCVRVVIHFCPAARIYLCLFFFFLKQVKATRITSSLRRQNKRDAHEWDFHFGCFTLQKSFRELVFKLSLNSKQLAVGWKAAAPPPRFLESKYLHPPLLNILLPLKLRRVLSYCFVSLSAPHPSVKIVTICFRERSHNMTGSGGLWKRCMAGLSGTGNLGKACCLELYLYIMAAGPHRLGISAFCLSTSSIHCESLLWCKTSPLSTFCPKPSLSFSMFLFPQTHPFPPFTDTSDSSLVQMF